MKKIYKKSMIQCLTMTKVKVTTNMGEFTLELYDDMPITTGNFLKLAKEGFYNNVIFHRIIEGFMIQGGDPEGTGMGGPGYNIQDEYPRGRRNKNNKGTIAMANAGPNTGGSQFFINLVNNNFLDSKHPVFGKIVDGIKVIKNIGSVSVGRDDVPVNEVKMLLVEII